MGAFPGKENRREPCYQSAVILAFFAAAGKREIGENSNKINSFV